MEPTPLPLQVPPAAERVLTDGAQRAARSLNVPSSGQNVDDIRKAAREFEAYFIAYLMKEMRATVPKGLIENKAGDQFYSFYDQEIGRLAAQAGGIGLGHMLELELTRRQAAEHVPQVSDGPNR